MNIAFRKTDVLISGGHLTPALAVIEQLRKQGSTILYVGNKFPLEGDRAESLEYQTITSLGLSFYHLFTGRFQRSLTPYTILSLLRVPIGLLQSFFLLLRVHPKVVVSFGGYIGFPVALSAFFLGIPIVIHEQTRIMGFSNRFVSHFASVVCVSYKTTNRVPKNANIVVTGLPMRTAAFSKGRTLPYHFSDNHLSLLYITGGSLGSETINQTVSEILPNILRTYRVLHQCGFAHDGASLKMLERIKTTLPKHLRGRYQVVSHISPHLLGSVLSECRLVVSRAGANTVAELQAFGIPSVLIPLPWSGGNEQLLNARALESIGQSIILSQDKLNGPRLLSAIDEASKIRYPLKRPTKSDQNAAENVASIIQKFLL
jgi:UDP-N-acetylglucosamine--N-acetylmuramyl-(pentapeptide) pyrophosphoryl-undecaprenol N-acetylglucosamine transferase